MIHSTSSSGKVPNPHPLTSPSSRGSALSWTSYLLPLLWQSWLVLAATLLLCAGTLALVARLGQDPARPEFSLRRSVTFLCTVYGGVAVRRWSVAPRNVSTRSLELPCTLTYWSQNYLHICFGDGFTGSLALEGGHIIIILCGPTEPKSNGDRAIEFSQELWV